MGMYVALKAIKQAEADRWLADPENMDAMPGRAGDASSLSLEKCWHGLHFLLTGSAMEGELPLAFLLQGGEEVGEDLGYGPPRIFNHEEVQELNAALSALSDDQLWSRFDPERMSAEGVYPDIWDEPEDDLREEFQSYFHEMKKLIEKASREKCALLVMLT